REIPLRLPGQEYQQLVRRRRQTGRVLGGAACPGFQPGARQGGMLVPGVDVHQVDVDEFQQRLVGKEGAVLGLVDGRALPAAEGTAGRGGDERVVEPDEEGLDRPLEVRGTRRVEVQLDAQLEGSRLQVVTGEVRAPVTDQRLRQAVTGPGTADARVLLREVRL